MTPGLNLEYARSEGLDLSTALHRAKEAGYAAVEAYVYAPVDLRINSHLAIHSESPYHHLRPDALRTQPLQTWLQELKLSFSALDAHTSLLLPQIGVPHLRQAIDLAADLACPLVVSDEGPVPIDWLPLDRAFDLFCASLEAVIAHGQRRGVRFAVELHNALTTQPHWLHRLLTRFGPDDLGVNFDTGNAFLAGNDPVHCLREVVTRVVHVHLKDIPASMLPERGRVTGTRVGVAIGEGVVDLRGVLAVLRDANYTGVLSVECDTLAQARASRSTLEQLIQAHGQQPDSGVQRP